VAVKSVKFPAESTVIVKTNSSPLIVNVICLLPGRGKDTTISDSAPMLVSELRIPAGLEVVRVFSDFIDFLLSVFP